MCYLIKVLKTYLSHEHKQIVKSICQIVLFSQLIKLIVFCFFFKWHNVSAIYNQIIHKTCLKSMKICSEMINVLSAPSKSMVSKWALKLIRTSIEYDVRCGNYGWYLGLANCHDNRSVLRTQLISFKAAEIFLIGCLITFKQVK